jgi:UDP-glucose 4-epimerase
LNILVTGGAGYIGSHVVKQLTREDNAFVTVVDSLCGGDFDSISVLKKQFHPSSRFKFYNFDLSNSDAIERLFSESNFDAVIHFAAHLQVGESVHDPIKYYLNNTVNTTQLVSLCIKHKVNKFIFSSTAAVYGEPNIVPIPETAIKNPINPYGMSKLMSESVIIDSAKAHEDFKYVILRYFNVAGADADGEIGESHVPETHLIPLVIHAAIGKRESICLFGDDYNTPDGSCIRDYVHVEDLANAHVKALSYIDESNKSNIFNCGYGIGYSVKEVIRTIKNLSGIDFKVDTVERREGDPAVLVADNSKIINEMGWKPKFNDLNLICESALKWEQKTLKNAV